MNRNWVRAGRREPDCPFNSIDPPPVLAKPGLDGDTSLLTILLSDHGVLEPATPKRAEPMGKIIPLLHVHLRNVNSNIIDVAAASREEMLPGMGVPIARGRLCGGSYAIEEMTCTPLALRSARIGFKSIFCRRIV
jgi:hypothetical protein